MTTGVTSSWMACLLAEIGTSQAKMDANQAEMKTN
jgi:hypothetical protein